MNIDLNLDTFSPYLLHYMGEWLMHEPSFDQQLAQIQGMNLTLHVKQQEGSGLEKQAGDDAPRPTMYGFDLSSDGIATVSVTGALMKHEASLMESTSTVMLRRTLRALAADNSVRGVLLAIDSPGGTAAGTDELAADVARLGSIKPVSAYISSMGASAAYWVASQAGDIVASPISDVGSIGTYVVVHDYAKRQEASGVKIHVIKAGEFKALGVPGTPIDEKTLAEIQRRVDAKQKVFTEAVATGRRVGLEKAQAWADGRTHVAAEAKALGLIDHVGTMDAAMERLRERLTSQPRRVSRMEQSMSMQNSTTPAVSAAANEPTNPQQAAPAAPATTTAPAAPSMASRIAEIKAACPGAGAEFVLAQVEAGASNEVAQKAFITSLNQSVAAQSAALTEKDKTIADLQAEVATLKGTVAKAQENSVTQAVSQSPMGQTPAASSDDPEAQAKADWAANKDSCQSHFRNDEKAYIAFRRVQGRIRSK